MAANGDFLEKGISDEEISRRREVCVERHRMLNLPLVRRINVFPIVEPPWPKVSWQRLSSIERKQRQMPPQDTPSFDFGTSRETVLEFADQMLPMPIPDALASQARYIGGMSRGSSEKDAPEKDAPERDAPERDAPLEEDPLLPIIGYFRAGLRQRDIIAAFKDHLSGFADSHPEFFESDDLGKGGYKTALKQLGALRLYCLKDHISANDPSFTEDELHDVIGLWAEQAGAKVPEDQWYRHPGKLASAATKAFKRIEGLFTRDSRDLY
jgi:hypothetical protein